MQLNASAQHIMYSTPYRTIPSVTVESSGGFTAGGKGGSSGNAMRLCHRQLLSCAAATSAATSAARPCVAYQGIVIPVAVTVLESAVGM